MFSLFEARYTGIVTDGRGTVTKVVSWNIAKRRKTWKVLFEIQADVALLQEVGSLPQDVPTEVEFDPSDLWSLWEKSAYDRWPTIVKLSNNVEVEWFKRVFANHLSSPNEIEVSAVGTVAAAKISPREGDPFIAIFAYARWIRPHPLAGSKWWVGHSDASAHRIMSDLSAFIGNEDPSTHRILVSGDFNNIYGATDKNPLVLYERDRTVFERMDSLGLEFMGPQLPYGRAPESTPFGLEDSTENVPTYYPPGFDSRTAQNQLDYVFASRGFHENISVKALNEIDDWGPSDHCRLLIQIDRSPTNCI